MCVVGGDICMREKRYKSLGGKGLKERGRVHCGMCMCVEGGGGACEGRKRGDRREQRRRIEIEL